MSNKASNPERLEKLVGYDPRKKLSASEELFKEVVADIRKEEEEKAKKEAREQLTKAIELSRKMAGLRKEFEAQEAKFNKELGKLLNRIENNLGGPVTEAEETEGSEGSEETSE
jgi:hypothetical protein